ncbi:terminase small subunit [Bacteroides sp. ET336]|uniref:terminase small subunit n=1 Tax=Bacteroides sp. ET336 TaxID=2972459 RepID=UPI0021ABBDC7|nr:terminase small subunit [Bacteroides sp. ET336]MCR8892433.1 terminase small subunit [Bacteroides sp. ET336]MDN0056929.1 terminase small subunit [Bacteroides caecigallinarum]
MNNRLTEKQERFCNYYLDCDGNASEAYRMAYDASKMQPETIWSNASRMLASNKVATRIAELRLERAEASKVNREKVEKILMDIVTMDPNDLYIVDPVTGKIKLKSPNQMPKRVRNAMKKISNDKGKVSYEFNGKVEAAKLLASMNGWNAPQQIALTGKDGAKTNEIRIGFDDEIE